MTDPIPTVDNTSSVPWYESIADAVNALSPAAKNVASVVSAFDNVQTANAAQTALTSTGTVAGNVNLLGMAFSQYWWVLVLIMVALLAIIAAVKK